MVDSSSRRQVRLAAIALLCLCACHRPTEPCRNDCWITKASVPSSEGFVGPVGVVNGILYAFGDHPYAPGWVVYAYDPVADTWTTKTFSQVQRQGASVAVVNGVLYVVGGSDRTLGTRCHIMGEESGPFVGVVETYDPVTDAWTSKASMPTARAKFGLAVVNGILYAVGGVNCLGTAAAGVEAYDPVTDTWTTKASLPTPRAEFGLAVVNGILYAVGGEGDNGDVVEAYDPAADTWTTKASMPTRRASLGVGVVNGILYAVGGFGQPPAFSVSAVEAYDPIADKWTTKAPMPTPRGWVGAAVMNGVLYVVGGENTLTIAIVGVNEAYQP